MHFSLQRYLPHEEHGLRLVRPFWSCADHRFSLHPPHVQNLPDLVGTNTSAFAAAAAADSAAAALAGLAARVLQSTHRSVPVTALL